MRVIAAATALLVVVALATTTGSATGVDLADTSISSYNLDEFDVEEPSPPPPPPATCDVAANQVAHQRITSGGDLVGVRITGPAGLADCDGFELAVTATAQGNKSDTKVVALGGPVPFTLTFTENNLKAAQANVTFQIRTAGGTS